MTDGENHDQHDDGLPRGWAWTTLGEAIVKADCIRFKPHPALADARYLDATLNSETLKKASARIIIVAEAERRLSVVQEMEAALEQFAAVAEDLAE